MKLRAILVTGLVVGLATLSSAGTCGAPTVVPSDGRIVDFDFIQAGTPNVYQFNVTKGHSYSVEVRQDYDPVNTDIGPATITEASCTGTAESGTDTSTTDPAIPANATRMSFTAANTGTDFIQVTDGGTAGTGRYISVSASETTLYSAGWTTAGSFLTAWSLANTTGQTITGDLILLDANGVQVAQSHVVLPAHGLALCYNSASGFPVNCPVAAAPANDSGSAIFAHNGPPGSLIGQMFVQNFQSSPVFTQPGDFRPIRQGK